MTTAMPRSFDGIWIPRELWLDRRLSALEKCVVAEIHSLDCGEDHCYASNDYLATFFNLKVKSISEYITKLKKLGFITQVSFNGRTRTIKSNLNTVYQKFNASELSKKDNYTRFSASLTTADSASLPPTNPLVSLIAAPIVPENKAKNKAKKNMFPLTPKGGGAAFCVPQVKQGIAPEEEKSIELKLFCTKIPEAEQPMVLKFYYANKETLDKQATNLVGYLVQLWKKGVPQKFELAEKNRELAIKIYESVKYNLNGVGFSDKGKYLELSGGVGGLFKVYYSDALFENDLMHFLIKKGVEVPSEKDS